MARHADMSIRAMANATHATQQSRIRQLETEKQGLLRETSDLRERVGMLGFALKQERYAITNGVTHSHGAETNGWMQ